MKVARHTNVNSFPSSVSGHDSSAAMAAVAALLLFPHPAHPPSGSLTPSHPPPPLVIIGIIVITFPVIVMIYSLSLSDKFWLVSIQGRELNC